MASLKNSSPEGKASAVQFLKFVFASELVSQFKTLGRKIVVGFDHPNYAHMAVLAEPARAALAKDFDCRGALDWSRILPLGRRAVGSTGTAIGSDAGARPERPETGSRRSSSSAVWARSVNAAGYSEDPGSCVLRARP